MIMKNIAEQKPRSINTPEVLLLAKLQAHYLTFGQVMSTPPRKYSVNFTFYLISIPYIAYIFKGLLQYLKKFVTQKREDAKGSLGNVVSFSI